MKSYEGSQASKRASERAKQSKAKQSKAKQAKQAAIGIHASTLDMVAWQFSHVATSAVRSLSLLISIARSAQAIPWIYALVRRAISSFVGQTFRELISWGVAFVGGFSKLLEKPKGTLPHLPEAPNEPRASRPSTGLADLHRFQIRTRLGLHVGREGLLRSEVMSSDSEKK